MNDDDLRRRLAGIDPTSRSDRIDPITSDRASALMEDIMDSTTQSTTRPDRHRMQWATGVAAALAVAVIGAGVLGSTGSEPTGPPLELTAQGGSTMASCIRFDVSILADMSPAFAGTVTDVTDSVATLTVDHWYAGGDADTVEISYSTGMEALIATPDFEVGQRYFVTATDGTVNGCGYSGPATPELEAAFDQAFPG